MFNAWDLQTFGEQEHTLHALDQAIAAAHDWDKQAVVVEAAIAAGMPRELALDAWVGTSPVEV